MDKDNTTPPNSENNDGNFRDRIEDFLKLCTELREEALKNGLDQQQFNSLLASILQEEEQEKELRAALHTARIEEFLQTCKDLRESAKAKGLTRDKLDIEIIAALMDNQTRFEAMKEKKEKDKDKQKGIMQNLLNTIKKPGGSGPSR